MKFKFFSSIVICMVLVLPSIAYSVNEPVVTDSRYDSHIPYNPKKVKLTGEFQQYHGYTIVAKIDTQLMQAAKNIENFIRASSFNKSYTALPAKTYHMSIYTIFSLGNTLIPPIQRWVSNGGSIPDRGFLPHEVLEEQNNEALCVIEKYLNETLYIKRATLNIGERIIGLTLELEDESLQRIRNARNVFKRVYEHPNKSMEPIAKKLHITLAYVYGKMTTIIRNEFDRLNELIQPFNGAKLMPPHVYLYQSMAKYYAFKKREYVDCKAYEL